MASVGGPMFFSNNMHTQISMLISLTSNKMSMHSNSHDIQQKDIDGVPHDSMVITQQATYMN
jgi:hypothetical protein